ncbi:hypothetical protein N7E81_12465 [Reichenbachiella carrageenanivorans]|uniref:Outer membrane protein beta-barrel domain-containing protein n=1 Tax=Reichenbachiella carrageenanivorans TaxID=2979869 RepID=A0ABY6CWC4_9BACT|nr:hypothetical protein [Reichenbachiella carrageenanivorans]UXX78173.1 hypothetical protein N7E81_12465 [Reichenbachiella carrageenanivorans]
MKKYIIIALVAGLTHFNAAAQMSVFHIDWNVGLPVGDLQDFIEDESYRGLRIGGRAFIYDYLSVGGEGGWQVYYDTQDGTQRIETEDGIFDLTGKQYRYLNTYPLMANIHFYLGEDYGVRPYIGTNAGVTFVNQRIAFGIYDVSETSTHFSIAPEIGAFIPIGVAGGGINIGARYDHIFKTSKLDVDVQSVGLFIGFIFMN